MVAYDCFHFSSFHDFLDRFLFLIRCFSCILSMHLGCPLELPFSLFIYFQKHLSKLYHKNFFFVHPYRKLFSNVAPTKSILHFYLFQNSKHFSKLQQTNPSLVQTSFVFWPSKIFPFIKDMHERERERANL